MSKKRCPSCGLALSPAEWKDYAVPGDDEKNLLPGVRCPECWAEWEPAELKEAYDEDAMGFEAASDLIVVGRNEDGEMVGECYFVSAVHKDGRRWRLPVGADSRGEYFDEYGEGHCWVEVNDKAHEMCEAIAAALNGGMSGRDAARWAGSRWSVDRPVYGSASHDEFALYDDDDWAIYNRGY